MTFDFSQLLSVEIAHYFLGLLAIPFFCFTFIKTIFPFFGIFALDADAGWFIYLLILFIIAIFSSLSMLVLLSAKYINRRINYTFSLIVACIECFVPYYGFLVGITTLIIFSQPSIKQLYNLD
ncbi:MAG: hypothetical protein AAGE84_24795 [Cyanobacteria bacterium P01_G01_bin.39]